MKTATETLNVLLIEDDEDDFVITRTLLARAQTIECALDWAPSYEEGLEAVLTNAYDVCLVDYRLGAHTGLELLEEVNERGGVHTPIILLTGQGDLEVDLNAMAAGAADYLSKARIDAPLLERSIRYARERRDAEQRIREQAALLDKARDAIIAYDMEGRVVYWNKSAERLTGWTTEEMVGEQARDRLYTESQQPKLREAYDTILEQGEWSGELRQRTKDGGELIVESRWTLVRDGGGEPQSVLVINTDVTERKQLESQFLRSQRMESIGRLVGGIAHDLGNLLVPILLGVKVLQQRYDDEKSQRTLSMIQKSAQRGSDMVEQVLAFARGVEGERVSIQLDLIIDEVEKIVNETFSENITVETEVADDLKEIVGDATQIQQVLMNLCVNARDAMEGAGRLTIGAHNVSMSEREARRNIDAKPGTYVCITVSDTGPGIPDDVIDKIFEPFFSTKPEGEGTGLGLSTAYSIVKSHNGFIDVRSSKQQGTTFRIFLPVTKDVKQRRPDGDPTEELRDGTGELVLIVDDEEFILDATQTTLEDAGYQAITANGGEEALGIMDECEHRIDAVITDLLMPGMSGVELIRILHRRDPNLPVLAASGVSDSTAEEALEAGARTLLPKPYTAEKLQAALQNVLHANDKAATA